VLEKQNQELITAENPKKLERKTGPQFGKYQAQTLLCWFLLPE
jgi:hypothetical protein